MKSKNIVLTMTLVLSSFFFANDSKALGCSAEYNDMLEASTTASQMTALFFAQSISLGAWQDALQAESDAAALYAYCLSNSSATIGLE
ncbi:MAG TPA: hypothetical protein ENJ60_08920 [Aeromonadales bacterium]|nr:hypothetical protein [Aeromonadales bacterium]